MAKRPSDNTVRPPSTASDRPAKKRHQVAGQRFLPVVLVAAGIVVYLNSFSGVFVLDDARNIRDNARIRQLWPPWDILAGGGRPVVELSFAVNYALGGLDVFGYHLFNLAVHILAALTLLGIVRRTQLLDD